MRPELSEAMGQIQQSEAEQLPARARLQIEWTWRPNITVRAGVLTMVDSKFDTFATTGKPPSIMRLVAHRSLSAIGLVSLWCSLAFASFTISPPGPTLEQCSQVDLIWTEEPPIRLFVVPNREVAPGDPILENLGEIDQSFLLWTVDLPVGQNVSFTYVRVAAQYTLLSSPQQYTVVEGSTSSCLAARTSSSSPAAAQPTQVVDQESTSWTLDPPQIAGITLAAVGFALILVGVVWRIILVRRHLRRGGTLTLFLPAKMTSKNKEGAASTTDGAASTADGAPATEPRTRKFKVVSARPAMMYTLTEQKNNEGTATDVEKGAAVPPHNRLQTNRTRC
ncbi:hypothetical protein C8Q74DRAFT_430715 [Fomes fomentarius]|nr:hypothetical protein C8Q74DRAFT_430715 [Fomes fomentarius]